MRDELPVIALLEETLLPGEERSFAAPALDAPSLDALAKGGLSRFCALSVASRLELPSLVSGRWGTEAILVRADAGSAVLRGERRVRLLSARGREVPYLAEVEREDAGATADEAAPAAILHGLHALIAALEAGAVPDPPDWPVRLHESAIGLLRALVGPNALREALQLPLPEALDAMARSLAARGQGQEASCALEAVMREIAAKPALPDPLRRRLWAQIVEIQKRLDVYDSTTPPDADGVASLQKRLMQSGLPKAAREVAKRELRLLRGMPTNHHDYSTYLAHLDLIARLPWHPEPEQPIDFAAVSAELDRRHVGLDKPKRRILEYLAVRALGGRARSTVLCLAGPPGGGKTSVAEAIAAALKRKFVRVPLGGVHDECEIRGHRMTYIGSMPGRILSGLATAESASVVMLLDEIDKIGQDRSRSPIGALLELLDPEQNHQFQDNYLAVPFDVSPVMFIATANDIGQVHDTLRDRMEVIELEGYTGREKTAIVRTRLLARLAEEHGLPAALAIDDDALLLVQEGHTREPGLRQIDRALASLHRARALARVLPSASGAVTPNADRITAEEVHSALGPPRYTRAVLPEKLPPGVATGLSVGPEGGAILFLEAARIPGKGELRLTGRLGEVMREAAQTAWTRLRMDPAAYGARAENLEGDFHLHVPDAATAKEGPSAGVAIFCAFLSAATGRPLRPDVAMTGEINLSAGVLPVGGVRAKLLAAERAGVRIVVLPKGNVADVPADVRVQVTPVETLAEAVAVVFLDPPSGPRGPDARAGRSGRAREPS